MKKAIIDIGSNSVRIAVFADGKVILRDKNSSRLGEGMYASGLLQTEPIKRSVAAVKAYAEKAMLLGVEKDDIHAFATAAVRNSSNGQVFVDEVKKAVNLPIDVLSGETEAKIALLGALDGADGAVVDIGGGSTEIIVASGGKIVYSKSVKLGAVVLNDICGQDRDKCEKVVGEYLSEFEPNLPISGLVAIGGTSSACAFLHAKLQTFDRDKTNGHYISRFDLGILVERLFSLTLNQRIKVLKLDEKRAEIICGGSLILFKLLLKYNLDGVTVSENDNLEGYFSLLKGKTYEK